MNKTKSTSSHGLIAAMVSRAVMIILGPGSSRGCFTLWVGFHFVPRTWRFPLAIVSYVPPLLASVTLFACIWVVFFALPLSRLLHFREFCLFDCLCLPWCCLTFVPIFGLSVFATVDSTAVGTLCLFQASVFQFLAFWTLPLTARISIKVGSICDYFSHILGVCCEFATWHSIWKARGYIRYLFYPTVHWRWWC